MKPGRLVGGRFRIEQLARSGGMGEIHLARDEHTGQRVALKVLGGADALLADRFEQEARVLSKLQHP